MNYTKEQIDTAMLTATTTVTPKIMQTLIQNIHKYQEELQSMNAILHLTDDIDSNALLMGIMFTAIQTNNQILRETLCQLLIEPQNHMLPSVQLQSQYHQPDTN